jgi:uncharacterized protein (DUF2461 family)
MLNVHMSADDWTPGLRAMRLVTFSHDQTPMMVWHVAQGEKVSKQIIQAAEQFALSIGLDPAYAFMATLPAGAEEFAEVKGITLVRADWVPAGFVCVGRGGLSRLRINQTIRKESE